MNDRETGLAHYHVQEAWVGFQLELSLSCNLGEAWEVSIAWDSHIIKHQVAIVDSIVA